MEKLNMKTRIGLYSTAFCLLSSVMPVNTFGVENRATNIVEEIRQENNNRKNWTKEFVRTIGDKVAVWQIKEFPKTRHGSIDQRGWVAGSWYMGLFDWAEFTGDESYYDCLKKIFTRQSWQLGNRLYDADDICVSQTYIDMYNKFGDVKMIEPTLARADWMVNNPSKGSIDFQVKDRFRERWTWCDALFMAPAVYSRLYTMTGNKKYMHFADAEFRASYNHLYDRNEKLFYRDSRYFDKLEPNGKKVFWGRGNGWVIGGLTEILKTLPADDKEFRPFYEKLFVEFSTRLSEIQGKDGHWHASLLAPEEYPSPETSSTGFIVYGLAYGINQGYLSKEKFLPIVKKGWDALVAAVESDGKLGWVQPIGFDPKKVTREMTEIYGPGAFLMTACEIYKLCD